MFLIPVIVFMTLFLGYNCPPAMYQGLWLSSGILKSFGSTALDLVRDIGLRVIEMYVRGKVLDVDVEFVLSVTLIFRDVLLKPSLESQV